MTLPGADVADLHHPWTRQREGECVCCAIMHDAYGDTIAELTRQLEDAQGRAIQASYTVDLLLGRPGAILHGIWLENVAAERALATEWERRLDGPRD